MPRRRPSQKLSCLALEDRATPAIFGNPWPDPQNITLSFAPDGTNYHGAPSNLFSELGGGMSTTLWQSELLRAFQTWASVANLNVSLVSDGGKAFGQAGPVQGNADYGDIRVGTRTLSTNELAVTSPYNVFGNAAGDIIINEAYNFSKGGAAGTYDLFTVALQEAGHALGLDNSTLPSSVMFPNYQGVRPGLSAADVSSIQALYGTRPVDRFEGAKGNETNSNAKTIKFVSTSGQFTIGDPTLATEPYVVAADLTTPVDVDTFKVVNPAGSTSFQVQLRTAGQSLLQSTVSVFNSSGVLIASGSSSDSNNGMVSVLIGNAIGNSTYTIRVQGAAGSDFKTGRYKLAVGTLAFAAVSLEASNAYRNQDNNSNDSRSNNSDLGKHEDLPDSRIYENVVTGSIHSGTDKDFYKIKTDDHTNGNALVVTAWALESNRLNPIVRVYNWDGNLQPFEVLANDGSSYTLQIWNVVEKKEYYIEIASENPGVTSLANTGNYFFSVDVRATKVSLPTLDTGTLTSTVKESAARLDIGLTRVYHFSLNASSTNSRSSAAGVRMTIYDANYNVVSSVLVRAGETVAFDIALNAGVYYIKFSGARQDGASFTGLNYTLQGLIRNDPIGPEVDDPTAAPVLDAKPDQNLARGVKVTKIDWWGWTDAFSDVWAGL